jgi:hypothetical protein
MRSRLARRLASNPAKQMLCLIVACGAASACAGKPFLLNGDANSAQVGYSGGNLAPATAVAKQHCARYERVPRFLESGENVAYFACENP